MTHISRPFQIALAALVLFIAVWFVALRGRSSGGESSSSSSSSPSAQSSSAPSTRPSAPPASQSVPGGGTPASKGGIYHGSAAGVEGLSRAIQRAQGAVAQSQQEAKQQGSTQASSGTPAQGTQTQNPSQTQTSQSQSSQQAQAQQRQSQQTQNAQQTKAVSGVPAMQALVEGELKQGKVVAVLFWNPKGAVDATVRRELRAAAGAQHGKLAVFVARSKAVGSFGSFTHTVQVYSTPTILLISANGKTSSVTGLTDAFSLGQAIKELKHAK